MATRVSSILAEIGIDSSKFTSGANMLNGDIGKIISNLGKIGAAAVAFDLIAKGLKFAVNEAIGAEEATTRLKQVLESTNGVSGMTIDSLEGIASALAKVTIYDDDTIKSAEALMLTFTKVSSEVFPDAMEAALNMSAAFGGDLQSSVIQLGKALNDPSGMAAMKRIGVSFSDAQIQMAKSMFEAGDMAGYQKLIMSELNTEVGGMAEAMGTTYAGQVAIFKNNLGELGETVGGVVLPYMAETVSVINDLFNTQSKLLDVQGKYAVQMSASGAGYDEYKKKIIDNARALGFLTLNSYQQMQLWGKGNAITNETAEKIGLLSEREYRLSQYMDLLKGSIPEVATQMGHLGVEGEDAASSVSDLAQAALDAEDAMKKMSDANKDMVSMAASFTQAEETYLEASQSIAEERATLLEQRARLIKQGYSETSTAIKGVDAALVTNGVKAGEVAAAHEDATHRIILGYLDQKAMADGILTDDEMEWLLAQGVQWGIYSADAISEMRRVQREWENWDPNDKNASFNINVNGGGPAAPGSTDAETNYGYANGGDFIVPPGYPNDSFPMRVQSGEHVQVTPAGQSGGGYEQELLAAIESLPRTIRDSILQAAG